MDAVVARSTMSGVKTKKCVCYFNNMLITHHMPLTTSHLPFPQLSHHLAHLTHHSLPTHHCLIIPTHCNPCFKIHSSQVYFPHLTFSHHKRITALLLKVSFTSPFLLDTQSFTHNCSQTQLVTHHLWHTIFHTHICHTFFFTHNLCLYFPHSMIFFLNFLFHIRFGLIKLLLRFGWLNCILFFLFG